MSKMKNISLGGSKRKEQIDDYQNNNLINNLITTLYTYYKI